MTQHSQTPRQVSVCLIIHTSSLSSQLSFLVVSSRKHDRRWVFPKGGIEQGEDAIQAGEREAWEEAGLIQGTALHLSHLLLLPDIQPHKHSPAPLPSSPSFVPSTVYSFELYSVTSQKEGLAEDWPEKAERERKWVQGWEALEEEICWGRRKDVMRSAIQAAKLRLS